MAKWNRASRVNSADRVDDAIEVRTLLEFGHVTDHPTQDRRVVSQVVAFSQGIDADPSCQGVRQIIRDCNVSSLEKLLDGRKVSTSETIRMRIRRLLQRCSSTMSDH